jgi:hypothetical protein
MTMLDLVLKWMGAGDTAIATMGPVLTIAFAWLGGFAITQAFKFPLDKLIGNGQWHAWITRMFAVCATWLLAHYLNGLIGWLEVIVAFLQPIAYGVALSVITKYWPWIEATKVMGKIEPSAEAVDQLTAWKVRKQQP